MSERRWSIRSAASIAALVIAGCATGPVFLAPEPPTPGFRAVVYVYRAQSVLGSGIKQEVWVDAAKTELLSGSYHRFEVYAQPASYAVMAPTWPSAEPAGGTWVMSPNCGVNGVALRLNAGQVAYVQLDLMNKSFELGGRHYFDYGCRLMQRDEAQALPVLRDLRQTNP